MTQAAPPLPQGLPLLLERDRTPPPPEAPPRPKVVIYGDSYAASALSRSGYGWPQLIAARLAIETVNMGVSGSGYVRCLNGSTFPYAATTNPVSDAAVAIVVGSQNDRTQDPAAVALAAAVTYEAVRRGCPGARLLVVGGHWPWGTEASANALAVRDAMGAVCRVQDIPFLDPIDGQWLTGRPGLIDDDGAHPNITGHAVIAGYIAPQVAALMAEAP